MKRARAIRKATCNFAIYPIKVLNPIQSGR